MDPRTVEFIRLVAIAGWSQAETARRLNITPGAVSQFFSGRIRPKQSLLNFLKLQIPEPSRIQKPPANQPVKSPTNWEKELLACVRKLSDSQRQLVLRVARELNQA